MSSAEGAEFLDYFVRELTYLREAGVEFAETYPKIASRLGIAGSQCSDPHIERLLESFAFLTARLQQRLDSEYPEFATALLGVLYPQYGAPVPAMAIAHMRLPRGAKLTSGKLIPKNTPLFAEAASGPVCRFRTSYPVMLWPLEMTSAETVAPESLDLDRRTTAMAAIRIRLQTSEESLRALREEADDPALARPLRSLRFHIAGSGQPTQDLYDLLFGQTEMVLMTSDDPERKTIQCQIHPVGFKRDEDTLSYPAHAHSGYRIMQEYLVFPEKFHFFDIEFDELPNSKECDILIFLKQRPPPGVAVRETTFKLGCTPIINLFPKISEPIRLDHSRREYRLIADSRRERVTEVYSIEKVTATSPVDPKAVAYEPFFSNSHFISGGTHQAFWFSRRAPAERADIPGSDVYLSFVDLDFHPLKPPSNVAYATLLCTNRDLATEMSDGSVLQFEKGSYPAQIKCITKPSPQLDLPLGGQALWRLISNLSLNHLSLSDAEEGRKALREILRSYLFADSPQADKQIQGILEVRSEQVTRRIGRDAWRGLCRGTRVTVTIDEDQFKGSSPILFGSVLSSFLALYAHINTFTELFLFGNKHKEALKKWPPMVGEKALL